MATAIVGRLWLQSLDVRLLKSVERNDKVASVWWLDVLLVTRASGHMWFTIGDVVVPTRCAPIYEFGQGRQTHTWSLTCDRRHGEEGLSKGNKAHVDLTWVLLVWQRAECMLCLTLPCGRSLHYFSCRIAFSLLMPPHDTEQHPAWPVAVSEGAHSKTQQVGRKPVLKQT